MCPALSALSSDRIPELSEDARSAIEADEGLVELFRVLSESHPPPRLDEAAAIALRSRATLTRQFRDQLQMGYGDLARRIRLADGQRVLLDEREWSIERVARAVGYATAFSFSRAFQAHFDMTPAEFRELILGN